MIVNFFFFFFLGRSSHSQKGVESFSGRRSQSFETSKAQDQKRAAYPKVLLFSETKVETET